MHFYKPGPFEEYIAKLSAISTCPIPDAWEGISKELDKLDSQKRLRIIKTFSIAACILILISIGVPTLIITSSKILPSEFSHKITHSFEKTKVLPTITASSIAYATKSNSKDKISLVLQTSNAVNCESLAPFIEEESEIVEESVPLNTEDKDADKKAMQLLAQSGNINNINKGSVTITSTKKKTGKNPWSLIGYLNPALSHNAYRAFNSQQNPNETGDWMIGGDLLFRRKIGETFSIYSGVSISPTGQDINNLILLKNQSNDVDMSNLHANTSNSIIYPDNSSTTISNLSNQSNISEPLPHSSLENTVNIQQRFYYMQIPFIVSSNVSAGIFDIEFKLGCAAGILVNNKFELYGTRGHYTGKTEEIKKYNASAIAAISVSIPLTRQVDLIVEPNIQLYFNPLNHNNSMTHPFASSVKVGVGYSF